jgi:exonuclease SbcC
MLKALKYAVEFSTGKKLSADITFELGLTAVSGPNESGKSMVLEMIKVALFGSAALRGKASDYKKYSLELDWVVRGVEYKVVRTHSKAELSNADGPVASGTRPVNEHIRSLFGYDMAVFDTANNCAQGEIERLGSMKPTERKALVDQTVGLTAIDDLIGHVSDEATGARRAHEAISGILVEPDRPEQPKGYQPSAGLKARLDAARKATSEMNDLTGWFSTTRSRVQPTSPGPAPSTSSVSELQAHEKTREENDRLRQQLEQRLQQIPTTGGVTLEEVEEAQRGHDHNALVRRRAELEAANPAPGLTEADIAEARRGHRAAWLVTEISRLTANGTATCPACATEFPHEHTTIAELEAELTSLAPFDASLAENNSAKDLTRIEYLLERRAKVQPEIDALPSEPVEARWHSVNDLAVLRNLISLQGERESIIATLAKLPALNTVRDELHQMIRWEPLGARFASDMRDWEAFVVEREQKQARRDELERTTETASVFDLETAHMRAAMYEAALASFEKANRAYVTNKLIADQHKERMEDLDNARKALRELKVRIKGYLLPSLNKVASSILSQMTGGERNLIQIDDDFEIFVDGQPLATLSGSGKAVANLAIRLGLGQVLTNKVFSVFMADEIDAAMDDTRAGYTAECLSRLTASIGQVVLVSHKTVIATHHIVLGSTNENLASVSLGSRAD